MFKIIFKNGHFIIADTMETHRFLIIKGFLNTGEFYSVNKSDVERIEIL